MATITFDSMESVTIRWKALLSSTLPWKCLFFNFTQFIMLQNFSILDLALSGVKQLYELVKQLYELVKQLYEHALHERFHV